MKTQKSELGKFIKKRRLSLGLSVLELAKLVGLSIHSIYAYEGSFGHSTGSEMTVELKNKFVKALQCNLSEIESKLPKSRKFISKKVPTNKLGKILHAKRLKFNLSQKALCMKIGIKSDWRYRELELGITKKMNQQFAESLSVVLEIPLDKLKPFVTNSIILANSSMTKCTTEFGKYIRSKRISLGISGEKLGKALDVSRATISLLELGKLKPAEVHLINLADVLNVKIETLEKLSA